MPILYVYASKKHTTIPFMVFSGCPWRWDSEKKELYVWDTPEGCYTFPIKEIDTTTRYIFAYGEVD